MPEKLRALDRAAKYLNDQRDRFNMTKYQLTIIGKTLKRLWKSGTNTGPYNTQFAGIVIDI